MIKYFLSLLCCVGYQFSMAQYNNNQSETDAAQWSIKISPLSLIEPDQAVTLATEFRPIPNLGIQIEGAYIFNTIYFSNNRVVSNTSGFRVVPEIRYYDIHFKKNVQRYAGLQFSYKQVEKDVEMWIYKMNYDQLEILHLKKYNMTGALIGGLQNHSRRIGYDFNIGIGLKYKAFSSNASYTNMEMFDNRYGETSTGFYPQLSASFKLCFKIM